MKYFLVLIFSALLIGLGFIWGSRLQKSALQLTKQVINEPGASFNIQENRAHGRNVARLQDLNVMALVIHQYAADNNGEFPEVITSTPGNIKSGEIDLCQYLIPKYFEVMPKDPNLSTTFQNCDMPYDSGYTVAKDQASGKIILNAPRSELGEDLKVVK